MVVKPRKKECSGRYRLLYFHTEDFNFTPKHCEICENTLRGIYIKLRIPAAMMRSKRYCEDCIKDIPDKKVQLKFVMYLYRAV